MFDDVLLLPCYSDDVLYPEINVFLFLFALRINNCITESISFTYNIHLFKTKYLIFY